MPDQYTCGLSEREWEVCLQDHYLRSDGTAGDTPLDSLDATPSELRSASGLDDLSDDEIISAFMSIFSREKVRKVLGDGAAGGFHAYRHFHYLVLTCVVCATTTDAGDTGNFRERLGVLLNDGGGPELGVQGTNSLWSALARWVEGERKKGEPYRRIVLPNPGSMTQIGYAVRLAYPSRNDRAVLKSILRFFPERAMENRGALLSHLAKNSSSLPGRMQNDLSETLALYREGELIGHHPFWRLIEGILTELSQDEPSRASLLWRLSLRFVGWNGDEVEASLARGNHRSQLEAPYWSGSFGELLDLPKAPLNVRKLLDTGFLLLHQEPDDLWAQDDRGIPNDSNVIIVSRNLPLMSKWPDALTAGGDWKVSDVLPYGEAITLTGGAGIVKKEVNQQPAVHIEGGVSLGRGKLLNRPAFLPHIKLEDCKDLRVDPDYGLSSVKGLVTFESQSLSDGRVRVEAVSNDSRKFSTSFQLISNAPPVSKWPTRSDRHEPLIDIDYVPGAFLADGAFPLDRGTYPNALANVLEAIYARAGYARPEGEIIQLIKRGVPSGVNPWAVLRSLEEAGWLALDLNRAWRGRFWRACPPVIVMTGDAIALVERAVGSIEFEHLKLESSRYGTRLVVNAERPWAVPVLGLCGEQIPEVAEAMGWKIFQAKIPHFRPAPACWPEETRSAQGRQLAGSWQTLQNGFSHNKPNPLNRIQLLRYVRDDDRDVYVVEGKGRTFTTCDRAVALLEYHRLSGAAQFQWADSRLFTSVAGGYLPLAAAVWVRRASFVQTGPGGGDDGIDGYVYGVRAGELKILAQGFGSVISHPGGLRERPLHRMLLSQRSRGERMSIYKRGGAGLYG